MIELFFEFAGDFILIKIDGNNILFGNTAYGAQMANIEGLKLSQKGVEKEHPDLKDNPSWREEAIKRFKDKIASFPNDSDKAQYIKEDLKKFGYKPKFMQINGFRKVKIS